ncbi:LuxR C-terminal-related transcriptional regulator [Nocardia arthritidis]|uniref:LuxR C-terminal-related transcriptional regulator n=1 Tax=Nocardia arthritidis TaxID=228602 RepID=UPI00142D92FD|nr:LuxR C-terminal-related transcriptional regulator [Nocardia arthritidis]
MRSGDSSTSEGSSRLDVVGLVARPELFERLGAARVTVVSAPPGSGKTVLLRSWIAGKDLAGRAALVPVRRDERDPQRFWISVVEALRHTAVGAQVVRTVSAAPELDEWALVERLLDDLAQLPEQLWLVIDDVHELNSAVVLHQLELLVLRAPATLRFVLATRHDLRIGLHRLRVEGELTEIRPADLRFTPAQTRELLELAGIRLPDAALAALHRRTEGWAAGLRLAALSLAGRADAARFAAEFSGSERTVAEYLLAEVLERQSDHVRRLLLRTSLLERVSGELADLLTGDSGSERVLQDLEQANAFVTSLDAARSCFRYHQMFADLLRLELRRTAPDEVAALHRVAAAWFAEHGSPIDAIRHELAAQDWGSASRLLADHWPSLLMDGRIGTVAELLADFPAAVVAGDGELTMMSLADALRQAPVEAEEQYLHLAERAAASVPTERRAHAQLMLGIIRLLLARHRWNLAAATEEARQLKAAAEESMPGSGTDLRALALVSLGTTESSIGHFEAAVEHLRQGAELAHRIGRPFLEFTSLAYQAMTAMFGSFSAAIEFGERAMELAAQHGWTDEPAAGIAANALATTMVWQGRLTEAQSWLRLADRTLRAATQPATGMAIRSVQGIAEFARGRNGEAVAALLDAERFAARLSEPNVMVTTLRAFRILAVMRHSGTEHAAAILEGFDAADRERAELRLSLAALRIAEGAPHAALTALAPVLDGSLPLLWPGWLTQGFLLEAIARAALGESDAAQVALERALDQAEPDGVLLWFLLHPVPELLERRARGRTGHASLILEIQNLLGTAEAVPAEPRTPLEALSDSEIRVLRYLPTQLSAPEIARELSVSPNTVKTHLRNLYGKLGVHRRTDAVGRARTLGLLAPATRHR